MELCELKRCTGCAACMNDCVANAISMKEHEDGFAYPEIDTSRCINCGQCRRACPELSGAVFHERPSECHAVMATDEIRAVSSSGGVFSLLAWACLNKGGVVYGAAFDNELKLRHVRADSVAEMNALRGSKYLQSAIGRSFCQVRDDLASRRKVLFVGTPCQVAGLRNFLNRDFENLLLVDLICHGVPSQQSFDKHLKEQSADDDVIRFDFRNKRDGWGGPYLLLLLKSGRRIYRKDSEDDYMCAFFAGLSLRQSCHFCQYAQLRRTGDFTIGDYWGAKKDDNDGKGTSLVFLNTPKAEAFWMAHVVQNLKRDKVHDASAVERIQPQLRCPAAAHPRREAFLSALRDVGFAKALAANICHARSVAIMNFHWENVNFGAVLTAFALNRYLRDVGYSVQNIDYIPSFKWLAEETPNERFEDFRNRHLPRTRRVASGEDLSFLNDYFQNFIVGSDQVWRTGFIENEKDAYTLSFTNDDKNLISCAASFGTEELDVGQRERAEYALRLSRFDHISVREESGVRICREMGLSATQIADPVFLLESYVWNELADSHEGTDASEVVYYTIDESKDQAFRDFIGGEAKNLTWNVGIEEWLWQIKNAKLLVTDSYHGSCFAILFNRPFVCINPNVRTQTRMRSLFAQLGIANRLYTDFSEVSVREMRERAIDYVAVNEKLGALREEARQFLQSALAGPNLSVSAKREMRKSLYGHLLKGWRLRHWSLRIRRARFSVMKMLTMGRRRRKYQEKSREVNARIKRLKNIAKEARREFGMR